MCACMCLCLCTHLGEDTRFATVLSGSLLVIQLTSVLNSPHPHSQRFPAQILNLLMIKASLSSCFTEAHRGKLFHSCAELPTACLAAELCRSFSQWEKGK